MEFETFDIVVVGLILFLSLKGMVNGFTKELFNLFGLVGGIALASRVNVEVGKLVSENIYPLNEPSLKLVGFVATLLAVWLLFTMVSSIFETVASDEIGFFSRILGYILTIVRYVAIFAMIVVGIEKSDFLSEKLSKHYQNSQLFPILRDIGSQLLNNGDTQENNSTKNSDINLSDIPIENNRSSTQNTQE